jgi:hypothetical protein
VTEEKTDLRLGEDFITETPYDSLAPEEFKRVGALIRLIRVAGVHFVRVGEGDEPHRVWDEWRAEVLDLLKEVRS